MNETFDQILSDIDNGNLSDVRKAVKKLTKLQMLDLIEYAAGRGAPRHITINAMRARLVD